MYAQKMDSDWAVFDNNRGQIYPLYGDMWGRFFNPGSINSFITICDYDEEKKIPYPFF